MVIVLNLGIMIFGGLMVFTAMTTAIFCVGIFFSVIKDIVSTKHIWSEDVGMLVGAAIGALYCFSVGVIVYSLLTGV